MKKTYYFYNFINFFLHNKLFFGGNDPGNDPVEDDSPPPPPPPPPPTPTLIRERNVRNRDELIEQQREQMDRLVRNRRERKRN